MLAPPVEELPGLAPMAQAQQQASRAWPRWEREWFQVQRASPQREPEWESKPAQPERVLPPLAAPRPEHGQSEREPPEHDLGLPV